MLQAIKQLFSKNDSVETDPVEEDFPHLDNPSFIIEPRKIKSLLSEIELASPLCTITLENSEQEYSSSILGVKTDKNAIILDELIPKEGNELLKTSKIIKLSTFHKGIHLSFNLIDIESGISRGITYYKAPLPSRVYYPQRRKAPRIEISSIDIAFSGIVERTGIAINGYLFDLSRGGAGIDLSVNRSRIQRGDIVKNCKIIFDDYEMTFDFTVRFVKSPTSGNSKLQIGGFFEQLSAKSQSKLSQFITTLERLEIRKQKSEL